MENYAITSRIGDRIKQAGWTQEETAQKTGIPQTTISRLMKAEQAEYSIHHLVSLSKALNVSIEDLFTIEKIIWSPNGSDKQLLSYLVRLAQDDAGSENKVVARNEDHLGLVLAIESTTSERPRIRLRCVESSKLVQLRNFDLYHLFGNGKDIMFELFRVLEQKGYREIKAAIQSEPHELQFYLDCGFQIESEESTFHTVELVKRLE